MFHLDMPASKSATTSPKVKKLKGENMKEEIKSGEFIAVTADGSAGETLEGEAAAVGGQHQVQYVISAEGEDGDHEGQTIGKKLKPKNCSTTGSHLDTDLSENIILASIMDRVLPRIIIFLNFFSHF